MAIFFMFAATAFVAGSVLRDDETGFGPDRARHAALQVRLPVRPLRRRLRRRRCWPSSAVTAGLIVGSLMPWVDPEKLGPFRPDAYAFAYLLVMAGPGLLFTFGPVLRPGHRHPVDGLGLRGA